MDREEGLGLGRVGGEVKTIKICCMQFSKKLIYFFNKKIKQKKQPKDKGDKVKLIKRSSLFI